MSKEWRDSNELPDVIEELKETNDYRDDVRYYIYFNPIYMDAVEEFYTILWLSYQNDIESGIELNYGCGLVVEVPYIIIITSTLIPEESEIILCPQEIAKHVPIKYLN